jgi:uncharacterized repeat protein (TIGR03803 family)
VLDEPSQISAAYKPLQSVKGEPIMRSFVRWFCISAVLQFVLVAVLTVGTTATHAQGQVLDTLYRFCLSGSPCPDGAYPYYGSLIQGSDGNFYGTTSEGGLGGAGTVFRITPNGAFTTLYSFCSQTSCADGSLPLAGLVQGIDGDFYGTTQEGGASCYGSNGGCGTIFKITPTGVLTTLYSFCPQTQTVCADGAFPFAGLIEGSDGNFYGTTFQGGTASGLPGTSGGGTIFKITPSGTLTTLYSFCSSSGCPDGAEPLAGVIEGTDGSFYGTTSYANGAGGGTVFKVTPTGTLSTLYAFCAQSGCSDGANPYTASVIQGSDGNFYGTTIFGGAGNAQGTVFKITPSGTLTTLYSFACNNGACPNGSRPYSGLIQASDGNLYGTTANGGSNGDYGTVFKITLNGALTTLYDFCSMSGCTDGFSPYAAVVEGTDGNLYGTTSHTGGPNDQGTVFSLTTGLLGKPAVTLSTNSLNFGMHQIGGAYPIPQVKLTNSGNGALAISSIQKTGPNSGDFSESDNCPIYPNTLVAGTVCTITPNFTPAHLGPLSAAINITDNAGNSPQSISLSGTAVDFSVSAVPVSNTIKGGKAASYTVRVAPLGGNTMTASLTVTGCPANASCILSSSQFALNGSTATSSVLTVKGNGKTPSGTFTLTISGKVFTVTHSIAVTLVVQ